MSDRDQRKDSPLRSEIRKTRDSDNRRSRDSPSRLEDSRTRDVSPRVSKQQRGVSEPDSGTRAPTVDEFGRFIRPGGSESDVEDSQYDRRRRSGSASRSRSRSPTSRRRRRSRSRSPRRHGRWSRSRRFVTCPKYLIYKHNYVSFSVQFLHDSWSTTTYSFFVNFCPLPQGSLVFLS